MNSFININNITGNSNSIVISGKQNEVNYGSKKTNNGEWKEARKCVEEDENLNEKQREILKKILSKAEESPSSRRTAGYQKRLPDIRRLCRKNSRKDCESFFKDQISGRVFWNIPVKD